MKIGTISVANILDQAFRDMTIAKKPWSEEDFAAAERLGKILSAITGDRETLIQAGKLRVYEGKEVALNAVYSAGAG